MPKATETVLEINLSALEHNYNYLRSKIKPTTKFLAVVKAYAYGSEHIKIAEKMANIGADYLAVAYVNEGVAIRKAGITIPILVLHPQVANFDALVAYNLEPSIYSPRILKLFLKYIKTHKITNYLIHLKFNTGLNRLGFCKNDVNFIIEKLEKNKNIEVASVFSHLVASEDVNEKEFTENQIACYKRITDNLDEKLGYAPIKHITNTSGILNYPDAQFNMVRSGIGIYGFGNDKKYDKDLRPVASLKTIISQIHKLQPNESVGYNRAYITKTHKITATLPIGHADGIGRIYGNHNALVVVNGQKASIIGNVCMDMIMIDITNLDCKEGDEVILFDENHSADALAAAAGTISYELITGISQRVKRIILK